MGDVAGESPSVPSVVPREKVAFWARMTDVDSERIPIRTEKLFSEYPDQGLRDHRVS